jgi:branched-chain amino acid transport system ATP-binding protein
MTGAATPDSGVLLSVEGLVVRYGSALALSGISLGVARGSALAVLGANGAGKSTLARTVAGLVPCAAGRIVFDGRDITGLSAHNIRRLGIVHLPEGRGTFPDLTVEENLRMATAVLARRQRRTAIDSAMEIFPSLAERRSVRAARLSGGEQQMLSLARALVTSPRLILADELSLGLSPKLVDIVFDSLEALRADGVTIVVIEQFIHRALRFADAAVLFQRGEATWQGPASDAKGELATRYLGHSDIAT